MKASDALRRAVRAQDLSLCWMTRVIGLALAACGIIFLNQDIVSSSLSQGFFAVCAAIGAIMVVTSFFRSRQKLEIHESAVLQPVAPRLNRRRSA